MFRYVLSFGVVTGVLMALFSSIAIEAVGADAGPVAEMVGYAVMLATLTIIFVGVKRYRDQECGGTIRFSHALGVGMAMAAFASIVAALGWEVYLASTDYAFTAQYAAGQIAAIEAAGLSPDETARRLAEVESAVTLNQNLFFRLMIGVVQTFPLAALMALASAIILRDRKVLPATA